MKILVVSKKGFLRAIGLAMAVEGDDVSVVDSLPPKIESFECVLTDTPLDPSLLPNIPIIGGDRVIPLELLQAMGFNSKLSDPDYVLFRWFDSVGGWSPQTIISFPLIGFMNDNLGQRIPTGLASRYISSSRLSDLFSNPKLTRSLEEMSYNGFVSLYIQHPSFITGCSTNPPFLGFFSALEGCPGKISDYLLNPLSLQLKESWSVALLLSRYPYPFRQVSERVFLSGLEKGVLKHFWMPFVESFRNSYFTESTILGVSTAWSLHLNEASRRAIRTCENIQCQEKQYRTDTTADIQPRWGVVKESGLI